MNKNTILYLCDGDIPTCRKDECYKRGGECGIRQTPIML